MNAFDVAGRHAVVVGAGGIGRAIALGLPSSAPGSAPVGARGSALVGARGSALAQPGAGGRDLRRVGT